MSWNDYPKAASNNARRAIEWKEKNGSDCGTRVGWTRARQLANGDKISRDTIARMASFKRHQQHKDVPYSEGCGGLMWDAWGGSAGVNWAITKLEEIDALRSFKMDGQKKISLRASAVDVEQGELLDISLIQIGDALGHGMRVDSASLESALEVLGDTLPAYITHENAFADRILGEVGFFSEFHIEDNKLKSKRFRALRSFKEDEPERYRRLFDIAENIPTNFGISLVFSARVVWVMQDGSEISFDDQTSPPEGTVADLPAIRFTDINSADFVDTPAANADGLFTQKPNIIMEEIKDQQPEEVIEEKQESEEIVVEASAETETENLEEQPEQVEQAEQADETNDALDLVASLEERLNDLVEQVASLATQFAQLSKERENADQALAAYVEGVEPQPQSDESTQEDIVTRFKSAQGKEFSKLWKENKNAIISQV